MFQIFDKLGGEAEALEALQRRLPSYRKPISPLTVLGWKTRRAIPGRALSLLIEECDARGISWEMSDFRGRLVQAHAKRDGAAA